MLITSTEKELNVSIDKSKAEMMEYSQGIKDKFEAELRKRQRRESDFQVQREKLNRAVSDYRIEIDNMLNKMAVTI